MDRGTTVCPNATDGDRRRDGPPESTAGRIDSYEVERGVVLYDLDNPLAWMETARPVDLAERT